MMGCEEGKRGQSCGRRVVCVGRWGQVGWDPGRRAAVWPLCSKQILPWPVLVYPLGPSWLTYKFWILTLKYSTAISHLEEVIFFTLMQSFVRKK